MNDDAFDVFISYARSDGGAAAELMVTHAP